MKESAPTELNNWQEKSPESPMSQRFNFNVDVVYDDLEAIIPQYNQFIESEGNRVPEEMLACQREALHTMRSIKNGDSRPSSKEELLSELQRREDNGLLYVGVFDLIAGILEN